MLHYQHDIECYNCYSQKNMIDSVNKIKLDGICAVSLIFIQQVVKPHLRRSPGRESGPPHDGSACNSMRLLPGMPLVKTQTVLRQMNIKLVQTFRALHRCEDVDETTVNRKQPTSGLKRKQPASAASLGNDAINCDVKGRDTCRVGHRVDKGCLDTAHVVVERACRGIERDDRCDTLRVSALVSRIAPAVEEGGAPYSRACVRGTGLDCDRIDAVVVDRAQRAVN